MNYKGFIDDVDVGDQIVIDSGAIRCEATEKKGNDIKFKVISGACDITTKRHINLYGKAVSLPTITPQDWEDIKFGIEKKVDIIALSFVRSGDDVKEVKEFCRKNGSNIQICSKVENYESTKNWEDIIIQSDSIMYARGDLSCEISFGEVPTLQKKMTALCSYYNRPIIIATQMVLSMVNNIQPTRAEVNDVATAVFDGCDAIMTSDETTVGKNPVNCIEVMAKICRETESNVYSLCTEPDCDDCFGVLHRGRLQRVGFESEVRPRKPGLHPYTNHMFKQTSDNKEIRTAGGRSMKRKFSCNTLKTHANVVKENLITILPFITDDIEAIVAVSNVSDDYMKNIAATRINMPMFGITANKMLCNQMNLIWNMQPIYDKNISEDFNKNCAIVDMYMQKFSIKKYLLAILMPCGDYEYPTVQVRFFD